MEPITVIVTVVARQGHDGRLEAMLKGIVASSRADEGCLLYALHRDPADPAFFFLYETWGSRALWEKHMETPHIRDFKSAAGEVVASLEVRALHAIG